jgi:hypothetical protein
LPDGSSEAAPIRAVPFAAGSKKFTHASLGAPASTAHGAPELEVEPELEALVAGPTDVLVVCEVDVAPALLLVPPPEPNVLPSRPRSAVQPASEARHVASAMPKRRAIHSSQQEAIERRKSSHRGPAA